MLPTNIAIWYISLVTVSFENHAKSRDTVYYGETIDYLNSAHTIQYLSLIIKSHNQARSNTGEE